MKSFINCSLLSLALGSQLTSGFVDPNEDQHEVFAGSHANVAAIEKRLVQLSPMEMRWVTEDEKLELKRQRINFMDITDHQHLGSENALRAAPIAKQTIQYPSKPKFQADVKPLLKELNEDNMKANLEKFTSFWTRYYKSDTGKESSEWLLSRVKATAEPIHDKLKLAPFPHAWPQSSIIASIPGKTSKNVVIGAHQDSINLSDPSNGRSPGADDDGSGTVVILEAFRVLAEHLKKSGQQFENTVEFHWYSAEEPGMLGSQEIFSQYEKEGRDVVAMLQQDMAGFIKNTLEAGKPESVGVITDFVDEGLTEFIKKIITEYCDIPYVLTKCGYACSDHASASKAGYPSAFVIESAFIDSNLQNMHTTEDKIEHLSFEHMLQHAKMTLGFVYELGNADFGGNQNKHSDEL
ncbi:Leucine aminopeptidase 1 [Rhizina undulata]